LPRARFANDCCSEGEHKVRPYICFGHWLDFDYYDLPENLCSLTYSAEEFEQLLELNEKFKEVKMFDTVEEYMEAKYTEKGIEKGIEKGRTGLLTQIIKSGVMTIDQIVQATGEQYEYVKNMFQTVQTPAG